MLSEANWRSLVHVETLQASWRQARVERGVRRRVRREEVESFMLAACSILWLEELEQCRFCIDLIFGSLAVCETADSPFIHKAISCCVNPTKMVERYQRNYFFRLRRYDHTLKQTIDTRSLD